MDEPQIQADEPVVITKSKRRVPIWGQVMLYVLPIIAVAVAVYTLLTPYILSQFYPQYSVLAKYSSIMTCTDTAADAAGTYTPMCSNVTSATDINMIGCIYQDSLTYLPPANASSDQQLICPLLVSQIMPGGQPAPGRPIFTSTEQTLRINYALIMIGIFTVIYITIILILIIKNRNSNLIQ
jgi:hypothetical protein